MGENVKHTPEPWICYADLPSTEPNWHIITTANKMRVIANVHIEPGNAVDEANASLITAAPDLLKALKGLLSDIEEYQRINRLGGENNHWQVISRAAIAKAEARP